MAIRFEITLSENNSTYVVNGFSIIDNQHIFYQGFNPYNGKKFTSIESVKSYIKDYANFNIETDTETENSIIINDRVVSEEPPTTEE